MEANKKVVALITKETRKIFALKWIIFTQFFPTALNKIFHLDHFYYVINKLLNW